MVRKLEATDFRARRMVLEPDDFALSDGMPERAPTDLISSDVWHGIMDIVDDVAISTTSHQGSRIELLYDLWGEWLEIMPLCCIVGHGMLDCADDFAASIVSLVHGFYRQAVGALRSALETMMFACLCQLTSDEKLWNAWEAGKEEVSFIQIRHKLRQVGEIRSLEDRAHDKTGRTMFADKNRSDPGGWATSLHSHLSNFVHARGNLTNGRMWGSNGPIYSAWGMKTGYHSYLETYVLLLLLAKIAHPSLCTPYKAQVLFTYDSRRRYLRQPDRKLCGFLNREVFNSDP
ncbi:MAG: hypothetical protein KGO02_08180 [Alphaproteobacteria bacterium]|nr:hypothetical protein [Alphaproteobacteria bacterium]